MDKQTKRCVQVKETEPKEKADVKNISKISKSQNLTRSLKMHGNYTKILTQKIARFKTVKFYPM